MTTATTVQVNKKIITVNEVLKAVNFPVESKKLFLEGDIELPEHLAVYRKDTKKVISIVSDKYKLIENSKVFSTPLEAITDKSSGFFVKRWEIQKGGARTAIDCLSNDEYKVPTLGKEEVYKKRVVLENSYDKSSSLRIVYGAWRLICKNGAGIWLNKAQSFRIIHVGDKIDQMLIRKNIIEALKRYDTAFNEYMQNITLLAKTKVKEEEVKKILTILHLGASSQKSIETITMDEYAKKSLTFLSLYHAITQMYSRKEEKKNAVNMNYMFYTARAMGMMLSLARKAA